MQNFSMDLNNYQKAEVEDNFAPIPKGTYQVDIAEASFDYGQTKTGKHVGANRTLLKLKLDVYNAKQDGGSRPMWTNLVLAHDAAASDSGIMNMVKKNGNHLFDLATQAIRTGYQGNVQASPFGQGLNDNNIHALVGQTITVDIYVNKAKENEIGSYFPQTAAAPAQQQQPVQQNYQQPVQQNNQPQNVQQQQPAQQVSQNVGNGQQQPQYTNNQPQTSTTGTTIPHSNQGGMPPFAMQQQQQA